MYCCVPSRLTLALSLFFIDDSHVKTFFWYSIIELFLYICPVQCCTHSACNRSYLVPYSSYRCFFSSFIGSHLTPLSPRSPLLPLVSHIHVHVPTLFYQTDYLTFIICGCIDNRSEAYTNPLFIFLCKANQPWQSDIICHVMLQSPAQSVARDSAQKDMERQTKLV